VEGKIIGASCSSRHYRSRMEVKRDRGKGGDVFLYHPGKKHGNFGKTCRLMVSAPRVDSQINGCTDQLRSEIDT